MQTSVSSILKNLDSHPNKWALEQKFNYAELFKFLEQKEKIIHFYYYYKIIFVYFFSPFSKHDLRS